MDAIEDIIFLSFYSDQIKTKKIERTDDDMQNEYLVELNEQEMEIIDGGYVVVQDPGFPPVDASGRAW